VNWGALAVISGLSVAALVALTLILIYLKGKDDR
jgi:hypothetical protein